MTALDEPATRHPLAPEARPDAPTSIRGVSTAEAVDDFRLACVSRAIDDREINLQKQSRVFFQISGAGHEALLLGLARHLRPGYDWFFPYYRDLALVLGLGVTPYEVLLQAVGSADDPASGGRQMPAHWGHAERHIVTQSSPTGSQCLPAVGCAEAARYLSRRPDLPGPGAHGDELTYVSLGEGACSEGEFWESLNTACTLHLPVLFVVADNGYAISVPTADQAPAPGVRPGPGLRRPRDPPLRRHRLLEGAQAGRKGHRPRPGRRRPRPPARRRHPAVLPLVGRHPVQVPDRATSWPTRRRTTRIARMAETLVSRRRP